MHDLSGEINDEDEKELHGRVKTRSGKAGQASKGDGRPHCPRFCVGANLDVFDYTERFYDPVRKHFKLDSLSPVQFEEGLKG